MARRFWMGHQFLVHSEIFFEPNFLVAKSSHIAIYKKWLIGHKKIWSDSEKNLRRYQKLMSYSKKSYLIGNSIYFTENIKIVARLA